LRAKEEAMKRFGTAGSRGVRWVDVEVVREKGPPYIQLAGEAGHVADRLPGENISLSITHTRRPAFAQVVFENEPLASNR